MSASTGVTPGEARAGEPRPAAVDTHPIEGDARPIAVVVYRSRTGKTRRFAEEIGGFLRERGLEVVVGSVGDIDPATLAEADHVLLGCWTEGWFVIHQHPDQPWVAFTRDVPPLPHARVGLFTTYALLSGTMFARMREHLGSRTPTIAVELKSRDGRLGDAHRRALEGFVRPSVGMPPGRA